MLSRPFDLLFDDEDLPFVLFVVLFIVVVGSSSFISSRTSSRSVFVSLSTSTDGFFRFSCCVRWWRVNSNRYWKIDFSLNKFQKTIKTTITITTIIAIYIPGEHMDSSIPDGQSSYELQTS